MTPSPIEWPEKVLEDAIRELVAYEPPGTVLIYHTHDSRRSDPGFPDLVIIGLRGILVRELKRENGRFRPGQAAWLDGFSRNGVSAAVWRPSDWLSGRIWRELRSIGLVRVPDPAVTAP